LLRRTLAAIRLSGDNSTIDVQSGVVAHKKAEVFDKNSIAVPDAENLIHLTLEGAGNLIGFDNGNQGDSTFMKSSQRKFSMDWPLQSFRRMVNRPLFV
jgi:beta-galactosidase